MDLEAMKAAFLAKGGAVTKVSEGEGAGLTNADWREAMRTPGRIDAARLGKAIQGEEEEERRAERYAEEVREAYHTGGTRARDEVMSRRRY